MTEETASQSLPTESASLDSAEDSGNKDSLTNETKEMRKLRKSKVGQLTRYMNIIRDQMKDATNVPWVKANASTYNRTLQQFKDAHTQYQQMLNEEERENDTKTWYQPKWEIICEFLDSLSKWMDSFNPKVPAADQKEAASVTSLKSKGSSKVSIISERVQAEAERAALMAKAAALKEKHELELEEEKLNLQKEQIMRKKEMLDIQRELTATSAKISVLENADTSMDGMNEYLKEMMDKNGTETELKDFALPTAAPTITQTASVRPKTETRFHSFISSRTPAQPAQSTSQMQSASSQHTASTPGATRGTVGSGQVCRAVGSEQLHRVLERQNDLTTLLVKQQQNAFLPKIVTVIFDGDIMQYQSFTASFEKVIESKVECNEEKLYNLEQYTRGPAQALVTSCRYMDPNRGFQNAKKLLQDNYGNKYKIASAYIERALSWPLIKAEDPKALQAYSLFLRGCCNSMQNMAYMDELDVASNLKAIALKLPFKVREK